MPPLRDFAIKAWPALILLVLLIVAERLAKPRFHRDEQAVVARGLFPAMLYVTIALATVLAQGRVE